MKWKAIPLCFAALTAFALTVGASAATTVASDTDAWGAGAYEVTGDVTIANRVSVSGDVTLNLTRGTLTAAQGIRVPAGASLTINGTRNLTVQSPPHAAAGIGGNDREACGTITINGGNINVIKGGFGGAGIGNGVEDKRGLYAVAFLASALCAAASYRVIRRKRYAA